MSTADTRERVVALGGGHGLAVTLRALRQLPYDLTAIVGVGDDGGSSGRIRDELHVIPPGDLRMALAALCGDDPWGHTWSRVMQHRFEGDGELSGHSVGNLLIAALWQETGDPVAGLEWAGALLRTAGRVLPAALEPVRLVAEVRAPSGPETLYGQVSIATSRHPVTRLRVEPDQPRPCPQAVAAISGADYVVLGPGSWFTSVLPHLAIPSIRAAVRSTDAARILVLNVSAQRGETTGYTAVQYLHAFRDHAPDVTVDALIVDESAAGEVAPLSAALPGAVVHIAPVRDPEDSNRHHAEQLAAAFEQVASDLRDSSRITPWR